MFHGLQGVRRNKNIKKLLLGLILLGLIFWMGEGVWGQYKRNRAIKKSHEEARQELSALEKRQGEIEEKLELLSTDRGIEEELRTKFQIVKPGEHAVIIVDEEDDDEGIEEEGGLWGRVKKFFSF